MRVVVPFDGDDPKTSLSPVLASEQRHAFAAAMLRDVLDALDSVATGFDIDVRVLSTTPLDADTLGRFASADSLAVSVTVDERPLDAVVNAAIDAAGPETPVAVVMADLALATPEALGRLLGVPTDAPEATAGDVRIAPGRGGGTNALVVRHPDFRVNYHGASYLDHLRVASEVGASVFEVDSMRLSTDIDAPADLAELLIHGDGESTAWLRDSGFEVVAAEAGAAVRREHE